MLEDEISLQMEDEISPQKHTLIKKDDVAACINYIVRHEGV